VSSSDLYVSYDGHDDIGCGDKNKPCASIRYAVSILKQTKSVPSVPSIYVNGSGAPYTKEGGTEYISISRSLNIIGVGGKFAVIRCVDQNQTKLFKFDGNSSQSDVVVTVKVRAVYGLVLWCSYIHAQGVCWGKYASNYTELQLVRV
jgi:hypothetical protein